MDKRRALVVVLLVGLFGLGLLGAWGYHRYTQVVLENQKVKGPEVTNLAGREISYKVESRLPGVTAALSSEGEAWIKKIMAQTNFPQDKSFLVMQNGRLTPVYPQVVKFVFEPINSLNEGIRQKTLYEQTVSGGRVVAGMQSELKGEEAIYTIYLDTGLLGSDASDIASTMSNRILRALFAANKQAPNRDQFDLLWQEIKEVNSWPVNVNLGRTEMGLEWVLVQIMDVIIPKVNAYSCSGQIECGVLKDVCACPNGGTCNKDGDPCATGGTCTCDWTCTGGGLATPLQDCTDFASELACTAAHNSACNGQCAYIDSCNWGTGVPGPTPTPGGGGVCQDSECSGTRIGTNCACSGDPECGKTEALGCEGDGGTDGLICTPNNPSESCCACSPGTVVRNSSIYGRVLYDYNHNKLQDGDPIYWIQNSSHICGPNNYYLDGVSINYYGPVNGNIPVNNTCDTGDEAMYRQDNLPAGDYIMGPAVPDNWFVVDPQAVSFKLPGDSYYQAWFLIDKRPSCVIAGPDTLYMGGEPGSYSLSYAEPGLVNHGEGYYTQTDANNTGWTNFAADSVTEATHCITKNLC